jgi:hypothetical protein
MTRVGWPIFRSLPVVRRLRFVLCALGLAVAGSGVVLQAQDQLSAESEPIHTLHVYTNLIQIPTLVLGPKHEKITLPIPESRFSISIDSGAWFRATHVRQEGDDPITLAIFLDLKGSEGRLLSNLGSDLANLTPLSLRPQDRVSVYALDCSLQRSLDNAPAEHDSLKQGVDALVQSKAARSKDKPAAGCAQPVQLWDALAKVTEQLYRLPGRRVILAVTDGNDRGSVHKWNELRVFAQGSGVAIFGMMSAEPGIYLNGLPKYEDIFDSLCQLSGGMLLMTNETFVPRTLQRFTEILRERYIVEFPRPAQSPTGEHSMQIRIDKGKDDFIRMSGIAVPPSDRTVQSDPSLAPQMGTRKILTKPQ